MLKPSAVSVPAQETAGEQHVQYVALDRRKVEYSFPLQPRNLHFFNNIFLSEWNQQETPVSKEIKICWWPASLEENQAELHWVELMLLGPK